MLRLRRWHDGVGTDEKPARTWVCEKRMCGSEAATNGKREIVVGSGAAEEEWRAGTAYMNIYSHEYAVYAYDTGKCAQGRGLSWRI